MIVGKRKSEQPYRVLRVVTLASATGKYGGPTDTAMRQARLLNSTTWRVRVVAASFDGDAVRDPLLTTARVRSLFSRGGYSALFSYEIASLLLRSIRTADLVHVSIARELVPMFASMVALVCRKPIVMQPHGMLTARSSRTHRAVDLLLKPLVRRADLVIALTKVEKKALLEWLGPNSSVPVEIVGNPSPDLMRESTAQPPVAFFAARLHPRKRVVDFVLAAKESISRGDSIRWVVAGPDQGDLEIVRAAVAETPNLSYVGAISPDEVDRRLATAAVFVLPSRDEPWGNVVATAIKARVPVVVTRSSAIAEEVERLEAGMVVKDGSPVEIATAVASLVTPARSSSNKHASAIDARFGNSGIAAALQNSYQRAVDRVFAGRPYSGSLR